jgi:hypothetical protein
VGAVPHKVTVTVTDKDGIVGYAFRILNNDWIPLRPRLRSHR